MNWFSLLFAKKKGFNMKCIAILLVSISQLLLIAGTHVYAEECNFPKVMSSVQLEAMESSVQVSKELAEVSEGFKKLMEKHDWPAGKPMVESMSNDEVFEFSKLQSKQESLMLLMLFESKRERDLGLLLLFYDFAKTYYYQSNGENIFDKFTDDINKLAILSSLQEFIVIDSSEYEISKYISVCNPLTSIEQEQNMLLDELNNYEIESAQDYLTLIKNKYNMKGTIDQNKLSEQERLRINRYQNTVMLPAQSLINYYKNLQIIKNLYRSSTLMYEHAKKDILLTSANMERIGESLNESIENGTIERNLEQYIKAWYGINEIVPCEFIDGLSQMEDPP